MDREALEFIEGDLSRATRVAESECAEMTIGVLREALARVRALLDESGSDNGCDNDAQCDSGAMPESPIRGWWTISLCPLCKGQIEGVLATHTGDCPNRIRAWRPEEVGVIPAPDEQAIERAARVLAPHWSPSIAIALARAVLTAALEQPE